MRDEIILVYTIRSVLWCHSPLITLNTKVESNQVLILSLWYSEYITEAVLYYFYFYFYQSLWLVDISAAATNDCCHHWFIWRLFSHIIKYQKSVYRLQTSCFIINSSTFSLLSQRKETRKYSHLRELISKYDDFYNDYMTITLPYSSYWSIYSLFWLTCVR